MIDNEVISSLQDRGTKYIPIGPDLRYISKLPGCGNNNFEEEYILGEDRQITRAYTVDDDNNPCYKEVIKYKNANTNSNYYELECFEYDLRPQRQDVIVDNDKMIINLHSRLENLPQTAGTVLKKYNLYQHPTNGERELVSQKVVESRFLQDNNKRKQIEIIRKQSGPTPLDSNIIFENGVFNPDRVPEGFDQLDNSVIPLPQQAGYNAGTSYILKGAASQYVGTNKILIATGSNGYDAGIINGMICHTGNTNDAELSGRGYFLPIVMQSLQDEGYTKLKIAVGISGYGIPGADPEHLSSGTFQVYLQSTNSPTYSFILNGKDISKINDLAENPPIEIYEIDLSGYQSYIPSYLFLGFMVGTSHIQKIQFE